MLKYPRKYGGYVRLGWVQLGLGWVRYDSSRVGLESGRTWVGVRLGSDLTWVRSDSGWVRLGWVRIE